MTRRLVNYRVSASVTPTSSTFAPASQASAVIRSRGNVPANDASSMMK
ncbi:hypothetical protein [Cryobacterium sp. Y50]|nr:hypothetical protein [Cryobacterium sp. Y50]